MIGARRAQENMIRAMRELDGDILDARHPRGIWRDREYHGWNDRITGTGGDGDAMVRQLVRGTLEMVARDEPIPEGLPRVEYENSMQGEIVESWRMFLTKRIFPAASVCPGCNGIIRITEPWHLYGDVTRYRLIDDDIRIPSAYVHRLVDGLTNAAIETIPSQFQIDYRIQPMMEEKAGEVDDRIIERAVGSVGVMLNRWRSDINGRIGTLQGGDDADQDQPILTYCSTCGRYCEYELPGHIPARLRDDLRHRIIRAHGVPDTTAPPPVRTFIELADQQEPRYRDQAARHRSVQESIRRRSDDDQADPPVVESVMAIQRVWGRHRAAMESSYDYRRMIRVGQGMVIGAVGAVAMWWIVILMGMIL